MTLKEIQQQLKLLTQEEKSVKRLLFSFLNFYSSLENICSESDEASLRAYIRHLKKKEQDLLPKGKFIQKEIDYGH